MSKSIFVIALILADITFTHIIERDPITNLEEIVMSRDNVTSPDDLLGDPAGESFSEAARRLMTPEEPFDEHLWKYNAETHWPGMMCVEGMGTRQSPINIESSNVIRDVSGRFIKYGDLKFKGYDDVLVSGINNGHTLQFSTEGDPSMHPLLTGGPLKHLYRLEQLHFHWLSEHAINGQKYPMELHFVHVRSDLDVDQALDEEDGLAIVAVFCNVLSKLADKQYAVDDDLMQHIPILSQKGTRRSGVVVNLLSLLKESKEYYTYAGSLTTPHCNEAVIWIILQAPIYITDEQYLSFTNTGIAYNNVRSIQQQSKHTVYATSRTHEMVTPVIVQAMQNFFMTIKDFFGNVGSFISRGFKDKYA